MHILSHYKGNSVSALCKYLKTFLSKHINWVASVGHDVLSKKRLAVEDYANDLSEGEIPLDPLGLLCIARNWHIHICVFLKNGIWTTRRDNKLENVSIYLLYTGGFTFFDTCVQLPSRPSILPQSNEENSTSDLEDVLTKSIMDTVGTKDSSFASVDSGTKDTSFATNTADVGTKDTLFASVDSGTKSASSSRGTKGSGHGRKRKKRSSSTGTRPKKRHAYKPRNPNTTASKIHAKAIVNSRKTMQSRQPLLPYSFDDLLSKNRKRVAKPNTLKEEDPILQAFKDNQPEKLAELLKDDCDEKNTNKSSLVSSDEVTTEGGKVQVKEYALKRRKKKQKTSHCSSDGCETTECTQKAMNVHEKENHLDISYTCSVCSATNFSSYESVFKHEQRHYKFIHPCDVCGKLFQFPSQVDKHKAVHDPKKGFICTWRGCKKTLANKDSLNQHVLRHQDLKLKCDQCPPDERTFPTTMSLKQHKQGKHGNGFIALCGSVCKWPDERREHQKECRECRNEKDKKLNKAENPWKPKKRNKIFKNRGVSKKPKKETENENDVNMDSKDSDTHIKSDNEDSETPEKEMDSKDIDTDNKSANQDIENKDNETPQTSHQEGSDE